MRIHRLALRHFRGVEACDLAFPDHGVVIVEGPNEIGKSSLADAIPLVLDVLDSSSAQAVRSVQTVGLDEGPEVELELSTGSYRFTLRKRWIRQRGTTLEITAPRHEQLSGRAAHERVREILESTADLALWRALRLDQGGELTQARLDVPSLVAALDAAVPAGRDGPPSTDPERRSCDDLEAGIAQEWSRWFTPTGLPHRERTALRTRLEAAEADEAELAREVASLEATAIEVAALEHEIQRLDRDEIELAATVAGHEDAWAAVQRARTEVAELDAAQITAAHRWERAEAVLAERQEQAAELDRLHARRDALALAHVHAAAALAGHQAEIDAAEAVVRRADELYAAAVRSEARARADRDLVADLDARHRLAELLRRVDLAVHEVDDADRELAGITVDAAAVEQLHELVIALARAEAVAEAGAATIALAAPAGAGATTVLVDGAPVDLGAETVDGVVPRVVTDEVVVEVPGHVVVTVQAGADARTAARRVAVARAELAGRCAALDVAGVDEARTLLARRLDLERTRSRAGAAIVELVGPDGPAPASERLRRIDAALASAGPLPEVLPPDLAAAEEVLVAASADVQSARRAREQVAAGLARLVAASAEVREREIDTRVTLDLLDGERAVHAARLHDHRAHEPDELLEKLAREADLDHLAARQAHVEAVRALARLDGDAVAAMLANGRDREVRLRREVAQRREELQRLDARLQVQGDADLQARLDAARSLVEHLRRRHERTEARAAAAELLHHTFSRHRELARQRYVDPFRERLLGLGRIVFGPDLDLQLGSDLRIVSRTLGGTTLPFEQLSVGAREQLGILSRLACAAIVSPAGGAPVLFDDALGWTDPARLERMGAAIAGAGEHCQVVIFTCVPDRYAAVGNATVVRLRDRGPGGELGLAG